MLLVVENSILFFVCFFVIVKSIDGEDGTSWPSPGSFPFAGKNLHFSILMWDCCARTTETGVHVSCVCLCASVDCVMLPVPTSLFWHFLSRWAQSDQEYHLSSLAVLCWFVLLSPCVVFLSTHFSFSAFISAFFVCVFFLFHLLVVFSFLGGSLVMEAFRWSVGINLEMNIYCFLFVCLPCCCHARPQACWWAWSCVTASPPPAITTRRRRAACWRRGPSAPCCLMSAVNSLSTPSKGRSTPERSTMWSRTTCCAR